ncbi:uncharacterized protein LOC125276089 [Megalobrama amblycephala]|nr:uncharacterized protein LOC125276089 [Megalobrama amblycephala]
MARMRSSPLGFLHNKPGLSSAICCKTSTFQQCVNVNSTRGVSSDFRGRNNLFIEQKSNSSCAARGQPPRLLLTVLRHSQKRRGSPSHSGFTEPQQTPQEIQFQNVDLKGVVKNYSSQRLADISRFEGRIFSHKHLSSTQKIPQVCLSGHSVRIFDSTVWSVSRTENFYKMCGSGAHTAEDDGSESVSIFGRSAALRAVAASGRERDKNARVSPGEPRLQDKRDEKQLSAHTRDNLPGSQTELRPVSSFSVGGAHQVNSRLFVPFSERKQSSIQTVFTSSGSDGLDSFNHSSGTVANEGFPALDSGTAFVSKTPPKPQSDSNITLHARSPSLERSGFSRVRDSAGSSFYEKGGHNGCVAHRLGCCVRGQNSEREMACLATERTHKLPGTVNGVSSIETFCAVSKEPPRFDQIRQHNGSGIHKSPGWHTLPSASQSGTETDRVGREAFSFTTGNACSGNNECGSGSPVQRKSAVWRMDSPPSGSEPVVGEVRPSCRRSLRLARKHSLPSILLSGERRCTYGCGCSGTPMAKRTTLRVSSTESDHTNITKSKGMRSLSYTNCPKLAREVVADGDNSASMRPALAAPVAQGPPLSSARRDFSPRPEQSGTLGLARERLNLSVTGLPVRVIETIQNARAASTRSVYDRKWRVFEQWCASRHIVPFLCSVADMLCFLQELLDKDRAFSTVKVYLAAISACHVGIDKNTIGQHPLVCRFMRGARRLHRVSKPLIPPWDLSVVLNALSQPPFEPIDSIELKLLSLKAALLLALSTAKRVSELHALSVHNSCMQFATDYSRVTLKTNPAFVPKVSESALACKQVDLLAFHPQPFSSPEDERLHCLCPVRALRHYVDRTKALRNSNQLFVSWADSHKGKPISRQRLSHWVVEAIIVSYNSMGLCPPEGLKAHSTRGMATSWALFKGVSVQDICAAASWASTHTFVRFYRLDVTEPSLAHSVLSV